MKTNMKQHLLWAGLLFGAAALASADTVLTFQVDMTQQIALGTFTNGVSVINARGTFNGYGTFPLTNNPSASNTNLYTGSVDDTNNANGTQLQYKYCIDSNGWENPSGGSCNRIATLPPTNGGSLLLPYVYFGDAAPAGVTATNNVTFQVDMTEQIALGNFDPATNVVNARGGFNGWETTAMTNDPSASNTNLYTIVVPLGDTAANTEHYKFCIGTNGWESPSSLNSDCSGNRVFSLLPTNGDVVLPAVFFNDLAVIPPVTNTITFQVDMTAQVLAGNLVSGDTVAARGSFEGWGGGNFVLTNNPNAANTNVYSGTTNTIGIPRQTIDYKYWTSHAGAPNNGYESPASNGGNNRTFHLLTSNGSITLPLVLFSDEDPFDLIPEDTTITFNVDMTGAVTTDGHVFNIAADKVYLNGSWIPWWAWCTTNAPCPGGPAQYQMAEIGLSSNFSITVTVPKGNALALTYKFSINGYDNEAGFATNHVRYVRTLGTYTLANDQWQNSYSEPAWGHLSIGKSGAGYATVSWLGLPGVSLESTPGLGALKSWANLPETDGTNWTTGFMSANGTVSTTNYSLTAPTTFFRLLKR